MFIILRLAEGTNTVNTSAAQSATAVTGGNSNLPAPVQGLKSTQAAVGLNAGVAQMVRPGLEAVVTLASLPLGGEIPAAQTLVTGARFGLPAGMTLLGNNVGRSAVKKVAQEGAAAVTTGIELTKKKFGHTFSTHGADMTNFLLSRAKGSGQAQGQFTNNQEAAQFILNNLTQTSNGTVILPTPANFPARVIMPDGTFKVATHIKLVPSGNGVKTAYPLIP